MRVCVIQMSSINDKQANLAQARDLIEQAVREDRPDLLVLPETWAFQGGSPDERRAAAETIPGGEAYRLLQELAAGHGVTIHGGSFLELGPERLPHRFPRIGTGLAGILARPARRTLRVDGPARAVAEAPSERAVPRAVLHLDRI